MAGLNVDGLVSGLDTSAIISQLMQIERQPQLRLIAKRDSVNRVADLYRQLNTRFQAIETAAEALNGSLDWRSPKATSSDESQVTATATSSATSGTISFRVTALASAHSVVSTGSITDPAATGQFSGGFTVAGVTVSDVGDGSLNAVASAINNTVPNVTATVVQTGTDTYRLQLTSKATGAGSAFTVTGSGLEALGTVDQIVTQGTDASLTVGDANPYTVTSSTNTITGLLPGVTLSLKATTPATAAPVTVTVAPDNEAIADKVDTLVKAVNDANTLIRTNSTYNTTTKKAGLLLSDQNASALSASIVQATTNGVDGGAYSPSAVGISISRDGIVSFDRTKFLNALAEDPDGVRKMFEGNDSSITTDDGIAERLRLAAASATEAGTGRIQSAIDSRTTRAKSLDDQIAGWDTRLELREKALRRQFTALETALGQAQSQSAWLAGQLSSLNTSR